MSHLLKDTKNSHLILIHKHVTESCKDETTYNLSKKMGRQLGSSAVRWSPRLATICPMQAMARSFTSWSISGALKRA